MKGNLGPAAGQVAAAEAWLAAGIRASLGDLGDPAAGLYPRRLKALCETSFLEHCASARPSPALRAALRSALLAVPARHLLSLLRHNLVHANLLLPILAAMKASRLLDTAELVDLDRLLPLCSRYSKERLPFRQLDLLHALARVSGRERHFRQIAAAARYGCLGRLRFAQDVDPRDDYAVTHTVLYATDFGRRLWPPRIADPRLVDEVLDRLSWQAERERNLDLLAEYALCRLCLARRSERLDEELTLLVSGFDARGCWPGPADLGPLLEREGLPAAEHDFFANYHTTLLVREVLLRALGGSPGGSRRPRPRVVAATRPRARFWLPRLPPATASPLARLRGEYTRLVLAVAGGRARTFRPALTRIDGTDGTDGPTLAAELAYWIARAGGRPSPGALRGAAELPLAGADLDDRRLRSPLLARRALGIEPLLPHREAEAHFDAALERARHGTGAPAFEALLSACLLAPVAAVSGSPRALRLRQALRRALSGAMTAGEAGTFAALLGYGLTSFRTDRSALAAAIDFLLSMSAASLPFGWVTASGEHAVEATLRQEIRGLQAVLALLLSRAVAPSVLSRRLATADPAFRLPGPSAPIDPRTAMAAAPLT